MVGDKGEGMVGDKDGGKGDKGEGKGDPDDQVFTTVIVLVIVIVITMPVSSMCQVY